MLRIAPTSLSYNSFARSVGYRRKYVLCWFSPAVEQQVGLRATPRLLGIALLVAWFKDRLHCCVLFHVEGAHICQYFLAGVTGPLDEP